MADQELQLEEEPENLWAIVADGSWMHGKRYALRDGTMTIGRSTKADITLPSTHLSRQHAQLQIKGSQLYLTDLASANGTFVNEQKIQRAVLKVGDKVRFDTFSFVVEGPNLDRDTQIRQSAQFIDSDAERSYGQKWTSPGNRVEAPEKPASVWLKVFSALIVLVCLAYVVYLVTNL